MYKKILFGGIAILFAAATAFNIGLLQTKDAGDISLDAIAVMAEAHNEYSTIPWYDEYHKGPYDQNSSSPNYVYLEKIYAKRVYKTSSIHNASVGVAIKGLPTTARYTYEAGGEFVGTMKNCKGIAVARCDQNQVGFYPI